MGNEQSMLTQYDIEDVQRHVQGMFSQPEIAALYKRFCALDRSRKGFISGDEFLAIPEFALNPVASRLLQSLEGVNFKDFVAWLAPFSAKASPTDKARFLFTVYDSDGDGSVAAEDIVGVLRDMTGTFLDDSQREKVVIQALEEAGYTRDGTLTFEDFVKVLGADLGLQVEVPVEDD